MSATHDHLIQQLAKKLIAKKWSLATAESCTGGALSAALTSIPGTSSWLERGFVTYSNDAKVDLLDVKTSTLQKDGAVSEKCAKEMAIGGLKNSKADLCIAITGIAGPDGGTEDKPVGTVFIGISDGNMVEAKEYHFPGDRKQVRDQSISTALLLLIKHLDQVEKAK